MIHPLSDCKNVNIPESTRIWQFCIIFPNCIIGENCNICSHCLIEIDVKIGNHVTIKSGVQIWDGIEIEDNVMIGPNTTFTNDMFPDHKIKIGNCVVQKYARVLRLVREYYSSGLTIGENSFIGAGAVVTKDVPPGEIWVGNPAKF